MPTPPIPSSRSKSSSSKASSSSGSRAKPGRVPSPLDSPSLTTDPRRTLPSSTDNQSDAEDSANTTSQDEGGEDGFESAAEGVSDADLTPTPTLSTSTGSVELERLKQAVDAQMASANQRALLGKHRVGPSAAVLGRARVSPIDEETSVSPSLDSHIASRQPLRSNVSSTSTDSLRTVRGDRPSAGSLRQGLPGTPSYPFPRVSANQKVSSPAFHRPFTLLSPSTQAAPAPTRQSSVGSQDFAGSDVSTPMPYSSFAPKQDTALESGPETPDLYNLVLLINSEPTLESWWSTLTTIMREWYGAERLSLAIPSDVGDLENVPWGQKASFRNLPFTRETTPLSPLAPSEDIPLSLKSKRSDSSRGSGVALHSDSPLRRPSLVSRHSVAGHEHGAPSPVDSTKPVPVLKGKRPSLASRTKSHSNTKTSRPSPTPSTSFVGPFPLFSRGTSFSDVDFSSIGGEQEAESSTVFTLLRPLENENEPLMDNASINTILDRGRIVTLTRNYSTCESDSASESRGQSHGKRTNSRSSSQHNDKGKRPLDPQSTPRAMVYEEFEQHAASPWVQSPAPSPAVQTDTADNPFFADANVDEGSFDPSESSQDYTQYGAVEAIGVDKASTVIHVPLIHPVFSRPLQSAGSSTEQPRPKSFADAQPEGGVASHERKKAPIAILSFLAPDVPYPQTLINSLKLFAPHMATSYSNASQYSEVYLQASNLQRNRAAGERQVGFSLLKTEADPLEELLHLDFNELVDASGSVVTSPSDYSGLSRPSPGSSMVETPAWDPAGLGSSGRQVGGGQTPSHLTGEAIDSYFDAKKAPSSSRHEPKSPGFKKSPSREHGSSSRPKTSRKKSDESTSAGGQSQKPQNPRVRAQDFSSQPEKDVTPRKSIIRQLSQHKAGASENVKHSRLHSYGAEFDASYHMAPGTNIDSPRPSGPSRVHTRSSSLGDNIEMKPPSERLLRILMETIPVQVFTAAPASGNLTWVNARFLSYRNRSSRQVKEDPWEEIHSEDVENYKIAWEQSLRTGQQLQQKVRLKRFDGLYRWFYIRIAPLKDKRQNLVHWTGTCMDIHDQHIAELNFARQEDTAASEAKYRALANSSPQIVFAANKSNGVMFCNSQWLHYAGQTEQEAFGVGFMNSVHPDDITKCKLPTLMDGVLATDVPTTLPTPGLSAKESQDSVAKPMPSPNILEDAAVPQSKLSKLAGTGILKISTDADGRPSYSTEVRLRSKEGQYRWHLVRIIVAQARDTPTDDETWYGTCTDINDHKMLEKTLKETMDAKSRFLSNMSHEIRTPLNGITGMVNFLIDSSLTTEQMEHVSIIRSSTEGLRDLINDILDLSKVEAGMVTLNKDWLHVRSLIEEVNDLTSSMAIGKNLELNYLVHEDVPTLVKGDRFRIRQVLLNVVGNAIKFTDEGEVFVGCRVHADSDRLCSSGEIMLEFEIIDTGTGFTDTEKAYLFKRFSQIDASSTRQHGGTGLGLAISNQLVGLHGGKMDAIGEPGKGSKFFFSARFTLPAHNQSGTNSPLPGSRSSMVFESSPLKQAAQPGIEKKPTPEISGASRFISSPSHTGIHESPGLSSDSSAPSIRTAMTSVGSTRSSVSSVAAEQTRGSSRAASINLQLPPGGKPDRSESSGGASGTTATPAVKQPDGLRREGSGTQAPMFSILVVCPLHFSRMAAVKHIQMTLPKAVPYQIADRANISECHQLVEGDGSAHFTHIVLVLPNSAEVIEFLSLIFKQNALSSASVVVVSNLVQKREVIAISNGLNIEALQNAGRLKFIFKPLKPSKLGLIFDPQGERESSTDLNQDSAAQVVWSQKEIFRDLEEKLGGKGKRVLLVEDNAINQMVLHKFLGKIKMDVETVVDGIQCVNKVFNLGRDYYSVILCDLHMPNKDGYQTAKEIRHWERANNYKPMPIVALSANVLGDVYSKCVDAQFNAFLTKPVDFKELSTILKKFLDPEDPSKPPEFMQKKL